MVKEIPLSQGKVALVDDEDIAFISQWRWHYSNGYAIRNRRKDDGPGTATIKMHRAILAQYASIDGLEVDHRDLDGCNNVRSNIRPATHGQNRRNTLAFKSNKTKLKGVYWNKRVKKYQASITVDRKAIHLGYYTSPQDAQAIYDNAARRLHGDFSRPNSPETADVSSTLRGSPQSPYRGVYPTSKTQKRWMARIRVKDEFFYLGSFLTQEEAATAYDRAARRYHGNKARLNFPFAPPSESECLSTDDTVDHADLSPDTPIRVPC